MKTCYVIPGLLASSLHTPDNPTYPDEALWVSFERLALGEFGGLRLDALGTGAGPPDGEVCRHGGPLPQYFRPMTLSLANALAGDGYQVRTWGYDWRKAIFPQGDRLAADIRNFASQDDPCSIVAHSQGGLVARAAWAVLAATGETHLIRRIVTLGTPHRGSYAPVMVWSLAENLIDQLSIACNVLAAIDTDLGGPRTLEYVTRLSITKVTATWPAFYQMLPLVDDLSALGDPLRAQLFNIANWPADLALSELHLLSAFNAWQTFLRSSASMPGPGVLTTVAGSGKRTPFYLDNVRQLGTPAAIGFSDYGDGRVMTDSAAVLPGTAIFVASGHDELTLQPAVIAQLPGWILAIRDPGPPPPIPEEQLDNGISITAGPPGISGITAQHDC